MTARHSSTPGGGASAGGGSSSSAQLAQGAGPAAAQMGQRDGNSTMVLYASAVTATRTSSRTRCPARGAARHRSPGSAGRPRSGEPSGRPPCSDSPPAGSSAGLSAGSSSSGTGPVGGGSGRVTSGTVRSGVLTGTVTSTSGASAGAGDVGGSAIVAGGGVSAVSAWVVVDRRGLVVGGAAGTSRSAGTGSTPSDPTGSCGNSRPTIAAVRDTATWMPVGSAPAAPRDPVNSNTETATTTAARRAPAPGAGSQWRRARSAPTGGNGSSRSSDRRARSTVACTNRSSAARSAARHRCRGRTRRRPRRITSETRVLSTPPLRSRLRLLGKRFDGPFGPWPESAGFSGTSDVT